MQTFDQSLMVHFKQNVITYEEALRQSSNPDDFALRVSGISATSDSSWDSFEGGKDDTQQPGGPQQAKPAAQRPAAPPAPRTTPSGGVKPVAMATLGKLKAPSAPAPAKTETPASDDDFQIERF